MKKLPVLLLFAVCFLFVPGAFAAVTVTSYTFNPNPSDVYDLDHGYYYAWGINQTLAGNEVITSACLTFKNIRNWTDESFNLWVDLLDTPPSSGVGTTNNKWTLVTGNNVLYRTDADNLDTFTSDPLDYGGAASGTSLEQKGVYQLFMVDQNTRFVDPETDGTYRIKSATDTIKGKLLPETGETGKGMTIAYYFTSNDLAKLEEYLNNDNKLGIGFDPDCHFYNDGITLTLQTEKRDPGSPVPEPATLFLFGMGLVGLAGIGRKQMNK